MLRPSSRTSHECSVRIAVSARTEIARFSRTAVLNLSRFVPVPRCARHEFGPEHRTPHPYRLLSRFPAFPFSTLKQVRMVFSVPPCLRGAHWAGGGSGPFEHKTHHFPPFPPSLLPAPYRIRSPIPQPSTREALAPVLPTAMAATIEITKRNHWSTDFPLLARPPVQHRMINRLVFEHGRARIPPHVRRFNSQCSCSLLRAASPIRRRASI